MPEGHHRKVSHIITKILPTYKRPHFFPNRRSLRTLQYTILILRPKYVQSVRTTSVVVPYVLRL